jgi:Putative transposase
MPNVFWPIFGTHRHLQHDLPSLGAAVIQQWAWTRYRVRLCLIVVQHTFGGRLNHHPHLHVMVPAGGLNQAEARWVESLEFDHEQLMILWRFAVCSYLWKAHRDGLLDPSSLPKEFNDLILRKTQRRWNIHITRQMSKRHFLGYAGRYIRRLPISQRRILRVTEQEVVYQYKDTQRSKETRMKIVREARSTPAEFIAMLSQHVLERYQHSMRYFRLLEPRAKRTTSAAVFLLLGQKRRSRPQRLNWRTLCSETSTSIPSSTTTASNCIGSATSSRHRPSLLFTGRRHSPSQPQFHRLTARSRISF